MLKKNYKAVSVKRSFYVYVVFLQRCWRAKKRRQFGCHFHNIASVDNPLARIRAKILGWYKGWKTRRILEFPKMKNTKTQAKEMLEFYQNQNNPRA